ncbi:hypothetical protein RR48_11975 [Papilio machaon]|uniref:Uncharacterized protein n=1 Tax=Papilio machaon TaxID=76193 RepID=A0A194RKR1_PAPMA|nr:hypothetical protein RR48_11975 [Papilio machaon]
MSFQNNDTLEINSNFNLTKETVEGSFIDDLSHLRLSYYRCESHSNSEITNDSKLTESDLSVIEKDTMLTDISDLKEEKDEQRKYISQFPDLPHPAYTMASIIASASNKMGSGRICFKYDDKVQVGTNARDVQNKKQIEFNPTRRSTLQPNSRIN